MNKLLYLIKIAFHLLLKCNVTKTIYLNFKILPFKHAIKLPIWVYGKIIFRSLSGKVLFESDKIETGMIKIGKNTNYVKTCVQQTILTLKGIIKVHGNVNFLQGNYILISKNAILELGAGCMIGSNSKIICFEKIIIGDNVRITWECQIIDTSFHYVEQLETNVVSSLTKPIMISKDCWVGNRTTISKGTYLPCQTIIASNSFVNKDLTKFGPNCLFAGSPAIFKTKCKRIFDLELEKAYDYKYNYDRTHL